MSATTNSPSTNKIVYILALALLIVAGASYWLISEFVFKKNYSNLDIASQKVGFTVAPDFNFKSFDGNTHNLTDFKDKLVILNFWASWCAPCLDEIPSMKKLAQKYPEKIIIVALSGDGSFSDALEAKKKFNISENNFLTAWDVDFKTARKFKVNKIPESFILTKGLKFHRKIEGSIDWVSPFAIKELEQLIVK